MKKVWIVAAGTGGHIIPGLTVAAELKEKTGNLECVFFGSRGRLEEKLVPEAGFELRFLLVGRWKGRGIFGRIATLALLCVSFFQCLLALRFGRPRFCISVGGYVSVPVVLAARVARVPVFLIEPNIKSGLANRILSRFATYAQCPPGADAVKKFFCKTSDAGTPIRNTIKPVVLRDRVRRVTFLGGSQGAWSISQAALQYSRSYGQEVEVFLQCGAANFQKLQILVGSKGSPSFPERFQVQAFVDDMARLLSDSDLVVARAGAMTVAELAQASIPTIFVPYPFAADDHQRVNARLLLQDQAVRLVDEDPAESFVARLVKEIEDLRVGVNHLDVRRQLATQFSRWARPNATRAFVERLQSDL